MASEVAVALAAATLRAPHVLVASPAKFCKAESSRLEGGGRQVSSDGSVLNRANRLLTVKL